MTERVAMVAGLRGNSVAGARARRPRRHARRAPQSLRRPAAAASAASLGASRHETCRRRERGRDGAASPAAAPGPPPPPRSGRAAARRRRRRGADGRQFASLVGRGSERQGVTPRRLVEPRIRVRVRVPLVRGPPWPFAPRASCCVASSGTTLEGGVSDAATHGCRLYYQQSGAWGAI